MTTPGTVLPAGSDAPPTTTAKANAGLLWGLIPVLLGGLVAVLANADVLFPSQPSWVSTTIAVVLTFLGPVASYFGVRQTPNKLLLPVTIGGTP